MDKLDALISGVMSRALGSGVPPAGGRGGGGRLSAGGDADTISIRPDGRNSIHTSFSDKKLINISAENLRELSVHKNLGRSIINYVSRGRGEAYSSNYALANALLSLDPRTGTYHVADKESFVALYQTDHPSEENAFEDRDFKIASARKISALEKAALKEKHSRSLADFRTKNDPSLRVVVEGAAPEEIKIAEALEYERVLLERETDNRAEMSLFDAKAEHQLLAIPRVGNYNNIIEKAEGIYFSLSSDAEAFLASISSPQLLLALTRHVESELAQFTEQNERFGIELEPPQPFSLMWGYAGSFLPFNDMIMFGKLASERTLHADGADGAVLPSTYLIHVENRLADFFLIKGASKEAWTMHQMLSGLLKTDGAYIIYERFFRLPFSDVTAKDVDDLRAAIKNSPRRIVVALRAPKVIATEHKVMKVEAKKLAGPSGKSTLSSSVKLGDESGKCFNCGETGHWKAECPIPPKKPTGPPGKQPYRVDKEGGYGHGGKNGRRFNNTILDSDGARANMARGVLLDSDETPPPLLYDSPDSLDRTEVKEYGRPLILAFTRSQICVVNHELLHENTPRLPDSLGEFVDNFLSRASRGLLDSGASMNLAPLALLHDRTPILGKVRYGDGEMEIIHFEGWLKIDILYGTLAAKTRSGRQHFKEEPNSFSLEVSCWGSDKVDSILFSTRAMAQGGAKMIFEDDLYGCSNDSLDFTKIGGPKIALAQDASFAVRYELPPTFKSDMQKKLKASSAAIAHGATKADLRDKIDARRAAMPLPTEPDAPPEPPMMRRPGTRAYSPTPASSSGQEN